MSTSLPAAGLAQCGWAGLAAQGSALAAVPAGLEPPGSAGTDWCHCRGICSTGCLRSAEKSTGVQLVISD